MGAVEAMLLEPQAAQTAKARTKAAAGEAAAPHNGGADLLLWVLAGDRQGEAEARRALGLSIAEAKAVRDQCNGRYERVRQLRSLGALLSREELAVLLRARVAEQLLAAQSAGELAALLRVFDKVPERADLLEQGSGSGHGAQYQPDGNDLSGLDMAACVAEAQRLLAEIEEETGGDPGSGGPRAADRQGQAPGAEGQGEGIGRREAQIPDPVLLAACNPSGDGDE